MNKLETYQVSRKKIMNSERHEKIQLLEGEQALVFYRQLKQVLPFYYSKKVGIEELALVKQPGWIAVPIESNFDLEFELRLQRMMSERGTQNLFAVLIETPETKPVAYKIPTTLDGIDEFNLECGALNCALFAEDLDWVMVCTVDEYYIVAGQESFVSKLVLPGADRAFAEFEVYIENLSWSEPFKSKLKTHLNLVKNTLKDYRQLQPGSSLNLPPV